MTQGNKEKERLVSLLKKSRNDFRENAKKIQQDNPPPQSATEAEFNEFLNKNLQLMSDAEASYLADAIFEFYREINDKVDKINQQLQDLRRQFGNLNT